MTQIIETGYGVSLVAATLQPPAAADAGAAALAHVLELTPPPSWPPEYNDEDTRAWMRQMLGDPTAEPGYGSWYVVAGGAPVGTAGYKGGPNAEGEVEIGYSIIVEARLRGYASGAVRLLLDRAFRDVRVTAVLAETLPELIGSQRVLESTGFRLISRTPDVESGEILRYRRARSA